MRARFLVACLGLGAVMIGTGEVISADARAIRWFDAPGEALKAARESGRPLLVYISSPYCGYCHKMERDTLSDSAVIKRVTGEFVALRVDGERDPEWMDRYQIQAFPALVVLSQSGEPKLRVEGYQSPRNMLRRLDSVIQRR
jgi:thioredoxin-related protein